MHIYDFTIEDIILIIKKNRTTGKNNTPRLKIRVTSEEKFIKFFGDSLHKFVLASTHFLPDDIPWRARIYCIENGISNPVICNREGCTNHVNFILANCAFASTCSRSCSAKEQNSRENYVNPFVREDFLEKANKTRLEKYDSPTFNNREKAEATCIKKYGVENVSMSLSSKAKVSKAWKSKTKEEIQEIYTKRENTTLERYGVRHIMHDETRLEQTLGKRYKWKKYTFGCGATVNVQGYEDVALSMLERAGYRHLDFYSTKRPVISYNDNNRYFPDFYIHKENRLIEVKSTYTVRSTPEKNKAKWDQCLESGYRLEIWILNERGDLQIVEWNRDLEISDIEIDI